MISVSLSVLKDRKINNCNETAIREEHQKLFVDTGSNRFILQNLSSFN